MYIRTVYADLHLTLLFTYGTMPYLRILKKLIQLFPPTVLLKARPFGGSLHCLKRRMPAQNEGKCRCSVGMVPPSNTCFGFFPHAQTHVSHVCLVPSRGRSIASATRRSRTSSHDKKVEVVNAIWFRAFSRVLFLGPYFDTGTRTFMSWWEFLGIPVLSGSPVKTQLSNKKARIRPRSRLTHSLLGCFVGEDPTNNPPG